MATSRPIKSPYLTVDEVAAHFRVSNETIFRAIARGAFPNAIRIEEGPFRITVEDLRNYERASLTARRGHVRRTLERRQQPE